MSIVYKISTHSLIAKSVFSQWVAFVYSANNLYSKI